MKGFATFFTSRGKKEKDASLSASGASSPSPANNNNNNKTKVPAIKVNDAFLAPPQRDHQSSTSSTTSSSRLALSRSFFRSVSDVSKSFTTASSTPTSASSSTASTPATETCTLPSATSSTSTVHLTVGRKPSNASLINDMIFDGSALNENGKARHEALPRAPTPSQLDRLLLVPRASSPAALAPPLQPSHPESSNGIPSPSNTTPAATGPGPNITSNIFDAYDPFAAHYTPPLNARKRLSPPTSVPCPTTTAAANGVSAAGTLDSPPQLLPQLPKVSSGAAKLLPVIQPKSAARPRALSLGSTAHHHHGLPPACPAHVLGPLPPLPPFAQGLIAKGSALAGARIDGKDADGVDPPNSAPAHAVTFFSKRDRSGSVASSGTTKSSTCSSVGGRPGASSSKRPMTSSRPSSSEKVWANHQNHVPASVSLGNSISEGANATTASWLDSTIPVRPGKRVPQLDQTWAQFLSETQSDFAKMIVPSSSSSGTASTITAGTASSTRTAMMMMTRVGGGSSSGGHVGQPRGPPPNRPLPPAPVPIQPLNIRRRARAQTVGTTSPMVSPAAAESIPATVSQPVVGLGVVGVLPISPPPTAGPKLHFDSSILDVVVTPATESSAGFGDITMTITDDDSKTASRPTTPATISSLPYLRSSESTNMLSLHAGRHSRGSSLSGSEWDGCSRTVSEMSLSLFPAPPPSAARSAPTVTEPPAGTSSSSLLPPPSSLSSVLELPTPPVTPTGLRFVPENAGLYSASLASRSTSTIRPPSKPEEEGSVVVDRDSCVLPLEDQCHLHHNTPATRPPSPPSVRYSADSTRSDPDFVSSATTVSSHEMDTSVEDSLYRTSLDTDQTSEMMMMHIVDSPPRSTRSSTHRKAVKGSPSKARMLWCPPSPPQADRHSTQGKDKFNLLPNFYFDATFAGDAATTDASAGQPPSTPIKHRKSGVARREQLLNLLSANETAAQLRSPGSPWGGRVEWGEAL
ncbi:hypothetical protein FRC04_001835 [Tulasnella sp. 424]|nr:hypothetical protein FRC04_001835 [Tulasnella sp. 424]